MQVRHSVILHFLVLLYTLCLPGLVQSYEWKTIFYENRIDHFGFGTGERYKQKYLVNWDHFQSDGPIFFYAGNEGAIELFAENTGFMWEIAPEFKAGLVFAEHRYYGDSMPFGNDSFATKENRAYLSSEQALADYAELLHNLKQTDTKLMQSPIIVFGGSYGGMLAAWFRMKYPHIVQGAIAASAPVVQFPGYTPCNIFADIVERAFKTSTPDGKCASRFGKTFKLLKAVENNDSAMASLSYTWNLCQPLKNSSDIEMMKDYITDLFGNVAMVNYPYPANFIMDLPAYPVKAMCEALDKSKGKSIAEILFDGFQVAVNYTGKEKCWDYTSGSSTKSLGQDGWDVQACTEMVMPMCTGKTNVMFPPDDQWDFENYTKMCLDKFSVRPRPDMAMTIYGSNWLKAASNIVFSNGDLDPWSGGSVYQNVTENSVYSILIRGGAHHLDLRNSNPADPQSVKIAREFEKDQIREWISQFQGQRDSPLLI